MRSIFGLYLLIGIAAISSNIYGLKDNYLYILSHTCKKNNKRMPDSPFITGDTFRFFSDHVYDETEVKFFPEKVLKGDIIFVNTYLLFNFFTEEHPKINNPYILITHNSDFYTPGEFINYLEDPKILAWFGCNPDNKHGKFIAIPLGLCNKYARAYSTECFGLILSKTQKFNLCYGNFSISTNYNIRKAASNYFNSMPFVTKSATCSVTKYLSSIANSKYVISPPGRGLDCYRVWESLYLNTIPIVLSSPANELYQDLPILIAEGWEQVTQDFLEESYLVMQAKKDLYNIKKLDFYYWWQQIEQVKSNNRYV